jgi:hypothetical protein
MEQVDGIPVVFTSLEHAKLWVFEYSNNVCRSIKAKYSRHRVYHAVCKVDSCRFEFKVNLNKDSTYSLKKWAVHTCEEIASNIRTVHAKSVIETVYNDLKI